MSYTPPPGDNIQIELTSGYVPPAGDAIAVELGGETAAVESGIEHVWAVYGPVQGGVQHLFDVLANVENGVEHVWKVGEIVEGGVEHLWQAVYSPVSGGIEHLWRLLMEAGVEHRWHMLPVVAGGINHRWSDLPMVSGGVRHSWRDLRGLVGGIEHGWIMYGLVERGIEHRFGVLGAVLQGGFEHLFDVRDTSTVMGGIQHIWVGGGVGVDQEFSVVCSFGGAEIAPHTIRRRRSRSEAGVELRLEMAGEPLGLTGEVLPDDLYRYSAADRVRAIAAARVEVDIDGVTWRCLATEMPESFSLDSGYSLVAESDLVLLDAPYADLVEAEYGPGMASAIAAELAADYGFTVDWQAVDWWVPGGVLYANNESPLEVLRKLSEAIGAMLQPGGSDSELVVKPFYPVSVPQWRSAEPGAVLSYGGDFFSVSVTPQLRPGYNLYEVSDQLSVSDSLRFEERDLRRGLKEIMAYEVPWTGVLPPLETSGGDWVVIEAGELAEEVIEDEEVELVQGAGRTQKPIYQIIDRDYGPNSPLGAISYGEDGAIKSELAGQSLCLITYRTRYWRWLVADAKDERVQLYSWPGWADMPVTLVVTFGDVGATDGFVVAEPDEERNVDGDGNVKSELAPGDPFHFLIQHDESVRIDAISCSDGNVSGGGMVLRDKSQRVVFADGAALELPYIPAGGVNIDWYGRSPATELSARKLKPAAFPAIGEAAYGARMRSYALSPPALDLAGEEKHYVLVVIRMVSV